MPVRKPLLILFTMAMLASINARPAEAQSAVELENVEAVVDFGEQIIFRATIKPASLVQEVVIVISEETQGVIRAESITVRDDGQLEYRMDARQSSLRPFMEVKWRYQFTFADGSPAQSETFSIRYADDRFRWESIEAGGLKVSWYQGDASFGQAALASAQAGLQSVARLLPFELTESIEVFVYANAEDLRRTLLSGDADWVAGHADPALGLVMVMVEPGVEQGILMEQRIPHELMHVLLYRRVGTGYHGIPAWLREGMATLVEIYPNPDHERVLAEAMANNRLIPLEELCGAFPASGGQAFLAYAESRSFTQYLHKTYGSTGLLNLALTYADGVSCENGSERALGVPLTRLEADWRASAVGQDTFLPALQNIAPYLVLLCLVLAIPLLGIVGTFRKKGSRNEPERYVRK